MGGHSCLHPLHPTLSKHKRISPPAPERSQRGPFPTICYHGFAVSHSQPQSQDRWHCPLFRLKAFQKYLWKTTAISVLTSAQLHFLECVWKGCHSCWQRSGQNSQWDVDKLLQSRFLAHPSFHLGPKGGYGTPRCFSSATLTWDIWPMDKRLCDFLFHNNPCSPQAQYLTLNLCEGMELYHEVWVPLCRISMVLTNVIVCNKCVAADSVLR